MNIEGFGVSALAVLTLMACVFKEHVPYTPNPALQSERRMVFQTDPLFEYPPIAVAVNNHT